MPGRGTVALAGACVALFAGSFAAGTATRDEEDRPASRPAGSGFLAEASPAPAPPELALGRAAGLPRLRISPERRQQAPYLAPDGDPGPAAPVPASTPPPPAAEPVPVQQAPPTSAPPPPVSTPQPITSSQPSTTSAPTPDSPPSGPQPAPDPAPSGGGAYNGEDE
jgi:hypothetical protein